MDRNGIEGHLDFLPADQIGKRTCRLRPSADCVGAERRNRQKRLPLTDGGDEAIGSWTTSPGEPIADEAISACRNNPAERPAGRSGRQRHRNVPEGATVGGGRRKEKQIHHLDMSVIIDGSSSCSNSRRNTILILSDRPHKRGWNESMIPAQHFNATVKPKCALMNLVSVLMLLLVGSDGGAEHSGFGLLPPAGRAAAAART